MGTKITNTPSQKCIKCFKALGVSTKLKIYSYLKHNQNVSVSAVVSIVGLKQPTVSYHLKDMKKNGLLKSKKIGKEVYYSVNDICPIYSTFCVLQSVKF